MNPGMFFDEVLESHEFRSSDTFWGFWSASLYKRASSPIMQTYWTLWSQQSCGAIGAFIW